MDTYIYIYIYIVHIHIYIYIYIYIYGDLGIVIRLSFFHCFIFRDYPYNEGFVMFGLCIFSHPEGSICFYSGVWLSFRSPKMEQSKHVLNFTKICQHRPNGRYNRVVMAPKPGDDSHTLRDGSTETGRPGVESTSLCCKNGSFVMSRHSP